MAHVILTGATGLVGSAALAQLLKEPASRVSKVSILGRRPAPMAEGRPNVQYIEHKDFERYGPEVMEKLKGAEAVIWAQGISVMQVSKEEYVKITVDYPLAAAKAFSNLSDNFKFVYVSGEGATTSPGRFTQYFGRIKGQAETSLLDLGKSTPSMKPFSVRPGAVDPTGHPEVFEAVKGKSDWITTLRPYLSPLIKHGYPSGHSPTPMLGKFLVDLALGDGAPVAGKDVEGDGRIIPNKAVRRFASSGK